MTGDPAPSTKVTLGEIFLSFLLIGATSFGGRRHRQSAQQPGGRARLDRRSSVSVGLNPAFLVPCGAVVGLFVLVGC